MQVVPVILNGESGPGHDPEEQTKLSASFAKFGLKAHFFDISQPHGLEKAVDMAVGQANSILVAGGGDGTINAAGAALVASKHEVSLGILPMGTLNHFAKDLDIPMDIEQAIRIISERNAVRVDVCEVNGRFFLNNSSIGLYPDIVHEREKRQARLGQGKWASFLWACLLIAKRIPFHTVKLTANGRATTLRVCFVFVGNNDYEMAGLRIGERKFLDEGTLCVWAGAPDGFMGLIRFAILALCGRLQERGGIVKLMADRVAIEAKQTTLRVATDGEVKEIAPPLQYCIHPKLLSVIVPKGPS